MLINLYVISMPSNDFEIRLQNKKGGKIELEGLASILKNIQEAIYEIAEYRISKIENKAYKRIRGTRPKRIHNEAKLFIKSVSKGSIILTLEGSPQKSLTNDYNLSEQSFMEFENLIKIFSDENSLSELNAELKHRYPDSFYRSKIIGTVASCWPRESSSYKLEIKSSAQRWMPMKEEKYSLISKLSEPDTEYRTEELLGVIKGGLIIDQDYVDLELSDGNKIKCRFDHKLAEKFLPYFSKTVRIKGEIRFENEIMKEMISVEDIKPLDKVQLLVIKSKSVELELKSPLHVETGFDLGEQVWVFSNEFLRIFSYDRNYSTALEKFQEDFCELYNHYTKTREELLTGRALELRKFFKNLIKNQVST